MNRFLTGLALVFSTAQVFAACGGSHCQGPDLYVGYWKDTAKGGSKCAYEIYKSSPVCKKPAVGSCPKGMFRGPQGCRYPNRK